MEIGRSKNGLKDIEMSILGLQNRLGSFMKT